MPKILKGGGLCYRVALADLLGDVWKQLYARHDWRHASLIPVRKKRDLCQCDNPPYARKKKMAPAGNERYNVFFFDGFYI